VQYCLIIKGDRFSVRRYEGEEDYSVEVERAFEKFKQGAVKDYRVRFTANAELNHVEAKILDFVALLYPETFANLDRYCAAHVNFQDEIVVAFDREARLFLCDGIFTHFEVEAEPLQTGFGEDLFHTILGSAQAHP
jgi:hypothetical protein